MKKILFIVFCCLILCGCEKKADFNLETTCTDNAGPNNGRMNYYTYTLLHNNNTIKEKTWMRSYEYETLSEALKEEKRAKKDCENTDYYCNISRNDKIITYYISYECGKVSMSDTSISIINFFSQDECDYYNEIELLEKHGFECTED